MSQADLSIRVSKIILQDLSDLLNRRNLLSLQVLTQVVPDVLSGNESPLKVGKALRDLGPP